MIVFSSKCGQCLFASEFWELNHIFEGKYGFVYQARNIKTGEIVTLKKMRIEREKDGIRVSELQETR